MTLQKNLNFVLLTLIACGSDRGDRSSQVEFKFLGLDTKKMFPQINQKEDIPFRTNALNLIEEISGAIHEYSAVIHPSLTQEARKRTLSWLDSLPSLGFQDVGLARDQTSMFYRETAARYLSVFGEQHAFVKPSTKFEYVLPIQIGVLGDVFFVESVSDERYKDLVGKKLIAFDQKPIEYWVDFLRPFLSCHQEKAKFNTASLLTRRPTYPSLIPQSPMVKLTLLDDQTGKSELISFHWSKELRIENFFVDQLPLLSSNSPLSSSDFSKNVSPKLKSFFDPKKNEMIENYLVADPLAQKRPSLPLFARSPKNRPFYKRIYSVSMFPNDVYLVDLPEFLSSYNFYEVFLPLETKFGFVNQKILWIQVHNFFESPAERLSFMLEQSKNYDGVVFDCSNSHGGFLPYVQSTLALILGALAPENIYGMMRPDLTLQNYYGLVVPSFFQEVGLTSEVLKYQNTANFLYEGYLRKNRVGPIPLLASTSLLNIEAKLPQQKPIFVLGGETSSASAIFLSLLADAKQHHSETLSHLTVGSLAPLQQDSFSTRRRVTLSPTFGEFEFFLPGTEVLPNYFQVDPDINILPDDIEVLFKPAPLKNVGKLDYVSYQDGWSNSLQYIANDISQKNYKKQKTD
jgi:hypothetical protein